MNDKMKMKAFCHKLHSQIFIRCIGRINGYKACLEGSWTLMEQISSSFIPETTRLFV